MGTLGSGNHFVEVCIDTSGSVWLMLHSGSRNIGKELAEHHIGVAQKLPHNQGLVDRDLAVFVADTPQMAAYRNDLFWAQEYARYNRTLMMALLKDVIRKEFKKAKPAFEPEISCHHNYVAEERYDGMDLLVTRKGAIRAGSGDYGIIPGSMGTGSYIVKGLGNEKSFNSASHGAGRMDEPQRRQAALLDEGPGGADPGRGVPQGLRRRGRDPGGLQVDRPGHRPAAGLGGGRGEAEAGRLREGLGTAVGVANDRRAHRSARRATSRGGPRRS